MCICSGALNNAAAKKLDLEAWFPGNWKIIDSLYRDVIGGVKGLFTPLKNYHTYTIFLPLPLKKYVLIFNLKIKDKTILKIQFIKKNN